MKIIIALLFSLSAAAQADSTTRKISIQLQARDIEYITAFLPPALEDFYDGAKAKFRVANPPNGNTLVQVDSVRLSELLIIGKILANNAAAIAGNVYSRYSTVLRAAGESYLVGKLNEIDTTIIQYITDKRLIGRVKLRRSNN